MEETKKYMQTFLVKNKFEIVNHKSALFNEFVADQEVIKSVQIIQENQQMIMANWQLKTRVHDIISQAVFLPNGTVNKQYQAKVDFSKLGWDDFVYFQILDLEHIGLEYEPDEKMIFGNPTTSGDLKLRLLFRLKSEADNSNLNEKTITLIINPDPKSLWKNKESDKNDVFWKEDNVAISADFLDKKIVIASKRGRSHANAGSFRDDDFSFKNSLNAGWSIVAVSDGAGSAQLARKGSKLACDLVVSYFEENFTQEMLVDFDATLLKYHNEKDADSSKKISLFGYENLSKAAWFVHQKLNEFALSIEKPIKDFHATLIFALVKKYKFGYAILTFSVGDCPIGLVNKDLSEINLMNWLDVGEFGGGTRFITMPEIFQNEKFSTRFGFKLIDDFSYLMLMTDGIYDPKFVVEAHLEKIEKWHEFIADLQGNNDGKCQVDFDQSNADIANQLSAWMDFWNPGNHDDRTLAVIY